MLLTYSILTDIILDIIKCEFEKPDIIWTDNDISSSDMDFLQRECNKPSEFDANNKRKYMFDGIIHSNFPIVCKSCEYGQIIGIFETEDRINDVPWDLWGRILRLFTESKHKPFKVFFLANESLRQFPDNNLQIRPDNINGGYTYKCNPETIVIYRNEDATRVLIHELQHSSCLDNDNDEIDIVETRTEAWAELIYIALLSEGNSNMYKDLLKSQSEWIKRQNKRVKRHMKNPDSREFPWRYTIGKEDIWAELVYNTRGFHQHKSISYKPNRSIINSLRLTNPPSNTLKRKFKIPITSNTL